MWLDAISQKFLNMFKTLRRPAIPHDSLWSLESWPTDSQVVSHNTSASGGGGGGVTAIEMHRKLNISAKWHYGRHIPIYDLEFVLC